MTFTREQIEAAGGAFYSGGTQATIDGLYLIWNAETGEVCRTGGGEPDAADVAQLVQRIEAAENEMKANPTPQPKPQRGKGKRRGNQTDRTRAWVETAVNQELNQLANLPEENINKPASTFSVSLLKIASVVKGSGKSYLTSAAALMQIKQACAAHSWLAEKEIERQWKRAYNKAQPRYRQVDHARPPGKGKPEKRKGKGSNGNGRPDIDVQHPKTRDFLAAFDFLKFRFRLNVLDDTIEVNEKPMNEGTAAKIRNRMRDLGLASTSRMMDAWVESAYDNEYHPVKDYFDRLEWDGQDWIGVFTDSFLTETTGLGGAAFKRWFVGAVAKVYEQAQTFMLVLDGTQGIGKSHLTRWLCPLPDYFIEGRINPDDKDFLLRLSTKLVWEVSELQSTTRKADREALKGFITTKYVTLRKAYARYDIVKPAMTSLIGTINEDGAGFLTDPTGNRRFVIINLEAIDWGYSEIEVSKLWAQAVALYKSGEPWELQPDERRLQRLVNAQYELTSYFSSLFFKHFEVEPESSNCMPAIDILEHLELHGLKGSQRANFSELARLMKKLECTRMRPRRDGQRLLGYKGVKLIKLTDL